ALLLREHHRQGPAAVGPDRAPAAGAAHRRARIRHRREPRLLWRAVAGQAQTSAGHAAGLRPSPRGRPLRALTGALARCDAGRGIALATVSADEVSVREGSPSDLLATFALSDRTMHRLAVDQGYVRRGLRTDADVAESWGRYRGLVEFLDAQRERRYLIAENSSGPVAFARVVRFG